MFLEETSEQTRCEYPFADEGVNRELRRLPGGMDPDDGD